MSEGFSNPVLGGQGALVRKRAKSPDYQTGVAGWSINQDGSAEFNNLNIRGTFFGVNYVINSAGIFLYSGTPAAGNLMISLAPASGTDGFGNAYAAGLAVYDALENLVTSISTNGLIIQNGTADGQFQIFRQGLSLTFAQQISHLAGLIHTYLDLTGTSHTYAGLGAGGFTINAGNVTGVHPGTGNTGTPAVAETWQTPTGLGSNWSLGDTSGTLRGLQYRMQPDGSVWLYGAVHCGAVPPGATIFTLPAGYFDSGTAQRISLATQQGTTFNEDFVTITTGGAVQMVTNPGVANTNLYFDNMIRVG